MERAKRNIRRNAKVFYFVASVLALIIVTPFVISQYINYQSRPISKEVKSPDVVFTIKEGDTATTVAKGLKDKNLIRSDTAFRFYLKTNNLEKNIHVGYFKLSPSMTFAQIAETLKGSGSQDVRVLIPEGFRNEEVARRLFRQLNLPEKEFLSLAKEGYMFPDTYDFRVDVSAEDVVDVMIKTFNTKVQTEIIASGTSLTELEVVTLASIVEKESRNDADRPVIAGILLNRLEIGQGLEVDATLQYLLGENEDGWWAHDSVALVEAKSIDSPYNTYKYSGLPPGPINNPGLKSVEAVLKPTPSNYFYYLHESDGTPHYAETYEQHQNNIANYL